MQVGTAVVLLREIEEQIEVLLLKRIETGLWELPGGKPDDGESPKVAAARELMEETGIEISDMELSTIGAQAGRGRKGSWWLTFGFVADLDYARTREDRLCEPDKFSEIKWVKTSELDDIEVWPLAKEIIDHWAVDNDELWI